MEIERAWADFDALRAVQCTNESRNSEYLCPCGAPKVFDGPSIDLPTCIACGRVDDSYISNEPEWRANGEDGEDPSRVGAPINLDHFSESWGQTTYMSVDKSAAYSVKRLATINMHASMNHKDRALFHAYADIENICKSILNLPENVIYQIKIKYRKFNESVLTRGAVRVGIKANCVFQACKEFGIARTTKEIADAFGIPSKDISRTFDMYQEQIPENEVHVTKPADLISRFFNSVMIPDSEKRRLKMKVVAVCKSIEDNVDLMGRTPKAIACAVMAYVLRGVQGAPTRAELCKICDISVPTLGKIEAILGDLKS